MRKSEAPFSIEEKIEMVWTYIKNGKWKIIERIYNYRPTGKQMPGQLTGWTDRVERDPNQTRIRLEGRISGWDRRRLTEIRTSRDDWRNIVSESMTVHSRQTMTYKTAYLFPFPSPLKCQRAAKHDALQYHFNVHEYLLGPLDHTIYSFTMYICLSICVCLHGWLYRVIG